MFTDLYNIPETSIASGSTINSVTVRAYMAGSSNNPSLQATGKIAIKTHGSLYYGTLQTLTLTWTIYSKTWTTNPNTGSAWTISELNALQIGVSLQGKHTSSPFPPYTAYYPAQCTQVWVEIDYTPATAKGRINRFNRDTIGVGIGISR